LITLLKLSQNNLITDLSSGERKRWLYLAVSPFNLTLCRPIKVDTLLMEAHQLQPFLFLQLAFRLAKERFKGQRSFVFSPPCHLTFDIFLNEFRILVVIDGIINVDELVKSYSWAKSVLFSVSRPYSQCVPVRPA
jgi:hypothetical protein